MFYRARPYTPCTREANGSVIITATIHSQVALPRRLVPPLFFFTRRSRSLLPLLSLFSVPFLKSCLYIKHQTIHFTCCHSYCSFPSAMPNLLDRDLLEDNLLSHLKYGSHHLSDARRLHALLVVGGFFYSITSLHVSLTSWLVHAYVKFGSLEEALLVFHKLSWKSNIAWNAILRGLVQVGQFPEAIEFYRWMIAQGMVPDNFTYPLALKACSEISALELGREVVRSIYLFQNCCNIKPNIYVECAMIDMFSKCGSLEEARKLFEDMRRKDIASWTAMICGTLQNGDLMEALHLFRRMRSEEGIQLDSEIVSAILPACGRLGTRQLGTTLQGCAVRSGFEVDIYVSNALVDMYCKFGDMHEAYQIFSNMVYNDNVSWSTLISGCIQNCQYQHGVKLYLEMKRSGIRTTAVTAASVLAGFAKLKLLKQGKEMHSYIIKQGYETDFVVGSALINMYASCGSKRESEKIFKIMSDRDITICNSAIMGHASDEDFDSVFWIFRRVWDSGLKPNSITLISILPVCTKMGTVKQGKEIHGYAIRSGHTMILSVGNSLIDMYCKCGYLDLGMKVFDQMLEKNIVTFNTIVSAHGIHGRPQQAFALFNEMKRANIRPNKVTFVGLLSACSHAGLIDRGWSIYRSMIDDYHLPPDMEHYSCIVDLLGRAGQIGEACSFVREMPIEPDINIFGNLLGACRVHNKVELADLIGRKISQENLKASTYHALLSNIYASMERWDDASKVRTVMKEEGMVKKPGKSWIEMGGHVHVFHARGTTHPAFHKIQDTIESLMLEMKNIEQNPIPNFCSNDLVGIEDEFVNYL
ncbi:hypothetical protein NMG60_11035192 [Bertholletia excelsa]